MAAASSHDNDLFAGFNPRKIKHIETVAPSKGVTDSDQRIVYALEGFYQRSGNRPVALGTVCYLSVNYKPSVNSLDFDIHLFLILAGGEMRGIAA